MSKDGGDLKVVAIEDGLEDIGKYLSAMGYKTVAWGQTDSAVDAVVYTGKVRIFII